jgi:predicted RNA-binding protein with PIN domain
LAARLGAAAQTAAALASGLQADRERLLPEARGKTRGAAKGAAGPTRTNRLRPLLSLPPAVFDDSAEAAEFLLAAPNVHLIVDGYNVALTSWPGSDLPALRDRLVSSLAEVALRQRLTILVVFDGDGDGGRVPPPPAARRLINILFSPSGVEADEEILRAVEAFDRARPVIVATDDRAVQDAARLRRASVLSVAQLLAAVGRHTSLR